MSLSAAVQWNRDRIPIFENRMALQEFKLDESISDFRWQYRVGQNAMFSLGTQQENINFKPRTGPNPGFSKFRFTNFNIYSEISLNSLDRNIFPRQGWQLVSEAKLINNNSYSLQDITADLGFDPGDAFGPNAYFKFSLDVRRFLSVDAQNTIVIGAFAGYVDNPANTFGDFYLVGAPEALGRRTIEFLGLEANEYVASRALGLRLGWQKFLSRLFMLRLESNYGLFQAAGDIRTADMETIELMGLGLTAGYQSFIGPIKFTASIPVKTDNVATTGLKYFLSIGHRF